VSIAAVGTGVAVYAFYNKWSSPSSHSRPKRARKVKAQTEPVVQVAEEEAEEVESKRREADAEVKASRRKIGVDLEGGEEPSEPSGEQKIKTDENFGDDLVKVERPSDLVQVIYSL